VLLTYDDPDATAALCNAITLLRDGHADNQVRVDTLSGFRNIEEHTRRDPRTVNRGVLRGGSQTRLSFVASSTLPLWSHVSGVLEPFTGREQILPPTGASRQ
jgi:hypothetical protein